jgi:hypothetical protein
VRTCLVLSACRSDPPPQTSPKLAERRAAAARDYYAWLHEREDAGEQITPGFVELKCQWSRRGCLAEPDAAPDREARRVAIDAHIARLTRFADGLRSARHRPAAATAPVEYFILEANSWRASHARQPRG